ncbi:MAG: hypothetical protein QOK21_2847 [Solirubrobacteraceae bacterium]|jgi:hypothetical protein|nr:hypothetical protein [Solirubrobacteraceae bacterium]
MLLPLIRRGQADEVFRTDAPAEWHQTMIMALIHAGSGELSAGRVPEDRVDAALVATVLDAVLARPSHQA